MWDPPGPGLEPMSPALAGGFLTTAPPGKSYLIHSVNMYYCFQTQVLISFGEAAKHNGVRLKLRGLGLVLGKTFAT